MSAWPTKPTWTPVSAINGGDAYLPADGVTATDMNRIVGNMLYLKKYGGRVNTLVIGATVSGKVLKLKSEETT